jgi:hypothetical protein
VFALNRLVALALVATAAMFASAQAAPVVVLSSTLGDLPPGSIVDGATKITVPAGGLVMINDATGSTRTLVGPYAGPIGETAVAESAGGSEIANSLSRLIASRDDQQAKLGAVRAAPTQRVHEPELLTVANSATQCVFAGEPISLWRPTTLDANTRLTIRDVETGAAVIRTWRRGTTEIEWPTDLPMRDSAKYQISLDVSPRPVELELHVGQAALSDPAAKIAWMRDVGCKRQALQMLALLIR